VSSENVSQRRPAMGRFSAAAVLTTCETSVFSLSTTDVAPATVTVVSVDWIGAWKSTARIWPTCSVRSVRTTLANPVLLTVTS